MHDYNKLKDLPREQLVKLALEHNINPHHKAKPETIIKAILEKVMEPKQQNMQHVAEKLVKPTFHNTEEDVEAAIAKIKERLPMFQSIYATEEDGSRNVTFRCKGAEECVNLAVPMRVILQKASNVSVGKRSLHAAPGEWDNGVGKGKNAYTETVIAG